MEKKTSSSFESTISVECYSPNAITFLGYFCGICQRQCHFEFNTVFWKSCIIFCAKPNEVDPNKLISLRQVSLSIALKYIINNSV